MSKTTTHVLAFAMRVGAPLAISLLAACNPTPLPPGCPVGSVRLQDGTCVRTAMYEYAQCVYGVSHTGGPNVQASHIDYCYSLATGLAAPGRPMAIPAGLPGNATMATPGGTRPSTVRCEIPIDFRAVPAGASIKGACAGLAPGRRAAVRVRGTNVATAAQILAKRVEWQLEAQDETARSREDDSDSAEVELAIPSLAIPSSGVITAELRLEFCPGTPGTTATCGLAGGTLVIEEVEPMAGVMRRDPPNPGRPVRDSL